ncbi:MAG: cation diffusion facilitator family transporter [Thermoleophilia bacterium]
MAPARPAGAARPRSGRNQLAAGTSGKPITIYSAIAANFGIAVTKFFAGAASGSSAMLSEGVHSLVDTGNQMLLLLGIRQSRKPACDLYPFGRGMEQYFWSLIVAILLFGAGGGVSLYEGVHRLQDPSALGDPFWSYVVLSAAILLEGASWSIAWREFKRRKQRRHGFFRALRSSKDPSIFVVLVEDTAAMAGLMVAFIGIYLGHRLDNVYFDGGASLLIGVILVGVSLFLIYESKGLLVGESADAGQVQQIRDLAAADVSVNAVHDLLTMHLGPDEILLNIELEFKPELGAGEAALAIDRIEDGIRELVPAVKRIFVEAKVNDRRQPEA